jgi:hypothetical protein
MKRSDSAGKETGRMGEREHGQPAREDDSPYPEPNVAPDAHLFDRQSAGAFAFYLALSLFFFGRGLLGNSSPYIIGKGPDPGVFVWLMAWWPHAIDHGLNPFLARTIFAPGGANLAWALCDPLAMLLVLPLTLTAGPIVTHNAVMLLAPALAGWAAFVMCRCLAGSYWPAWLGGFIFGFSPYIQGGMLGHEQIVLVFPIALIVWIVLRRLAGEISARRFVAAMVVLLIIQFGCFIEGFATAAVSGAMALGLALLFTAGDARRRLWLLVPSLAAAYAIAAVLLSPFLVFHVRRRFPARHHLHAVALFRGSPGVHRSHSSQRIWASTFVGGDDREFSHQLVRGRPLHPASPIPDRRALRAFALAHADRPVTARPPDDHWCADDGSMAGDRRSDNDRAAVVGIGRSAFAK